MHNYLPQLGCQNGQMGYFDKSIGAMIYQEQQEGQMGGIDDALIKAIQQTFPQASTTLIGNLLSNTKEGQQVQQQFQAMGANIAAAEAAARDASFRQQLESWYAAKISDVQANYKTYLMWGGIAFAALMVGVYFVYPAFKRYINSPVAASNPRRKRARRNPRRSRRSKRR